VPRRDVASAEVLRSSHFGGASAFARSLSIGLVATGGLAYLVTRGGDGHNVGPAIVGMAVGILGGATTLVVASVNGMRRHEEWAPVALVHDAR
jgi:hypothetical protein